MNVFKTSYKDRRCLTRNAYIKKMDEERRLLPPPPPLPLFFTAAADDKNKKGDDVARRSSQPFPPSFGENTSARITALLITVRRESLRPLVTRG